MNTTEAVLTPNEYHRAMQAAVKQYTSIEDFPEEIQRLIASLDPSLPAVAIPYYGGTIGMVEDEIEVKVEVMSMEAFRDRFEQSQKQKGLRPAENAGELLGPLMQKGLAQRVQVVWIPVTKPIDSINGRWPHWVTIAQAIKALYNYFDGFVVCGGTDTMAQMLAALRQFFPNLGKPIIGTGSQVPGYQMGDDATNNLFFSIMAAIADLSGIYCMFDAKLMMGHRVRKVKHLARDAFVADPKFHVGYFSDRLHLWNQPRRQAYIKADWLQTNLGILEGVKPIPFSAATPGRSLLYDTRDPNCFVFTVISGGAGNVRDESLFQGDMDHITALKMAHGEGRAIVLASGMPDGAVDSSYASGIKALQYTVSAGGVTGALLEIICMVALHHAWDWDAGQLDRQRFFDEFTRLRNYFDEEASRR